MVVTLSSDGHSHIKQGVRLPEDCPACARLWVSLAHKSIWGPPEGELAIARRLRDEQGEVEMLSHLDRVRKEIQADIWKTQRS